MRWSLLSPQIDKASSAYDSTHDLDGSMRNVIEKMHEYFSQLQFEKDKIIMHFGHLRDLVNAKFLPISSALLSAEKETKLNSLPNTLDDGEELLMEFEN